MCSQGYFCWKPARVNSFGRKSREPDQINKSLPQEMPACIYFTSSTAKHIMVACESQNAFSEVAVDKQKHSPVVALRGSRSLALPRSLIQSGKNNTTAAVALKNTSRERNSLSCVVAQLLFALRKPSTKIVSNFLCLCKSFGLSLFAPKHTLARSKTAEKWPIWQNVQIAQSAKNCY